MSDRLKIRLIHFAAYLIILTLMVVANIYLSISWEIMTFSLLAFFVTDWWMKND